MKKTFDRVKDQKTDTGKNGNQIPTDATPKLAVPPRTREKAAPLRKRKREGCTGGGGGSLASW